MAASCSCLLELSTKARQVSEVLGEGPYYVCRFLIVKAVVGNFSKEKALVDQMPSPGL